MVSDVVNLVRPYTADAPSAVRVGGFGISLPADDNPTQSLERIVHTNSW